MKTFDVCQRNSFIIYHNQILSMQAFDGENVKRILYLMYEFYTQDKAPDLSFLNDSERTIVEEWFKKLGTDKEKYLKKLNKNTYKGDF